MRSQLICRLHSDLATLTWARYSPAADLVDWGTCPLTEFDAATTATFLVPTLLLLLTEANLPTRQRQRQLQAVPYVLEDALAADVDTLHFALAPTQGQTVAVAVVSHEQMQAWERVLASYSQSPLVPDVLTLPWTEHHWSIALEAQHALVRTGPYSGFAIELTQLNLAIELAFAEHTPPQGITVYCLATQADNESVSQLQGLGVPVTVANQARTVAAVWAQGLTQVLPLNLRQGPYRPVSRYRNTWRPWRLTAALLAACALVYGGQHWLAYQQQQRYRVALEQQIEAVYRETFPDAQRIVNPRIQMEQRWQALQIQARPPTDAAHFLHSLSTISPLLQQTPDLVLLRLEYREAHFVLNVQLASLQALEQLQQRLLGAGLQVKLLSASSRNNRVESRLQITL